MEKMFKKENMGQLALAILFIIYLITGYQVPQPIAGMIDTLFGKIVVVIISLSLFAYMNPILAVLGLLVAFDLIRKSTMTTGTFGMENYMPCEEKKMSQFTAFNQFPYTLEQEVVKKMAPVHKPGLLDGKASFKPLLDDTHNASSINTM